MNSLLARQIRKTLSKELQSDPRLTSFLNTIHKSYENYEDQFSMLQRAMSISSQELFDANIQLKKEAEQQRNVIESLKDATKILRSVSIPVDKKVKETKELTGIELANLIEQQATQISKIEKQREKIFKDLQKSNHELSEYAHVVSHDLKSPLRTIDTLMNWIKEDCPDVLNDAAKGHMHLIDKNIQKMDNLIEGILAYSVIGKKTDSIINVNTQELVEEIIALQPKSETTHITITNTLPYLAIDKFRLKQLFQNLITNAIASIGKKAGIITIASETADDYHTFSITDNGTGIEKKYHKKIFEIFQTLDDNKETTGIGLSIVKKIIDSYQGAIWIKSELGKGTTFYFTLKNS
ncbi:ATP-binding protein [Aquimarina addita]|uniref:histidine kinase n=1 Tax=Aquimarina addita TaxID=870485 RepID=A0ABP6UL02_9FLAO